MGVLGTAVITVLIFMAIIIIHELGHFITAKRAGVKVHEFAVGFGPLLSKRIKDGTQYSLRAIPIGGYCKLEGEDELSEDEGALNKKPAWVRLIILVAGATLNILLGLLVFAAIQLQSPEASTLVVKSVMPGYSAASAGVRPGDRIVRADGQAMHYDKELAFFLYEQQGKPFNLTIVRGDTKKTETVRVTPKQNENGQYLVGVELAREKMNVFVAARNSVYETMFVSKTVVRSIIKMITGKAAITEFSGPVGAGQAIGQAASQGDAYNRVMNVLYIFAFLSVNIGIFNLLPFPALDGGRILFVLVEIVRRRPIDPSKEGYVHIIGIIILLLLAVVITWNDIYKAVSQYFGR